MKFKKTLYGVTAVAVAAGMLTTTLYIERRQNIAAAETEEGTGEVIPTAPAYFNYTVNDDGTLTIKGLTDSSLTEVNIPAEIDGKAVTAIEGAFFNNRTVTKVTIPDGVTTIGERAFCSCSKLTSVTIPESVTSIGLQAFASCESLTSIDIPDSVKNFGRYVFDGCSNLKSITIPNGANTIGDNMFYNCTNLTDVTIKGDIAVIGSQAFCNCKNLTNITFLGGATSILDKAFYGCEKLTEFTIPDGVLSIGSQAFESCYSIKTLTIPKSVETVHADAFVFYQKPQIETIIYTGTKEQWNKLLEENDWDGTFKNNQSGISDEARIIQPTVIFQATETDTPAKPEVKLDAPTNVKATTDVRSVNITWDRVEGAERYRVMIAIYGGSNPTKLNWFPVPEISTNSINLSGIGAAWYVFFKIAAINGDTISEYAEFDENGNRYSAKPEYPPGMDATSGNDFGIDYEALFPSIDNPPIITPSIPTTPPPTSTTPPPYIPTRPSGPVDPSEPDSSEPESSEPESSSEPNSSSISGDNHFDPYSSTSESSPIFDFNNPPTGAATFFVVPAILASGAVVIATMKRRKMK